MQETVEETFAAGGAYPDDEGTARRGREALQTYVLDVLFNPANREGSRFRGEVLAWRDPSARDAVKASMLAAAASWAPDAVGWQRREIAGAPGFAGPFGGLQATIRFPAGALPRVELELD